jgi:crotonobetainyl-CoA:carnitine CoA-transferase CaiB-like acyl-CoA transferase
MSGYGHSGPHQEYRSYGPVVQAVSGMTFMSGLPGREPSGIGLSLMDNQAAYYNSAALLAAIFHRMVTGEGCEIDVSAVEVGVSLLGADLLDVSVNDRRTRRPGFPTGNRLEHPAAAPHGVYPCAGDDRWVAIAVFDDADWTRLVEAMGAPTWAADPAFADADGRRAAHDRLDQHIAEWTGTRDRHDVMQQLQQAGLAAAAVQNPQDLAERDPQIAARGVFFELDHPVIGSALFEGSPMTLSRTDADLWRSAPLLGEDNDYVYGDILGLDTEERARLAEAGVI